ncbi:MAG TPA: type IV toxin-antitoxin system AbiEi family antitoxin domain-containing protein [Candidatus Paceibacterota bacterium]|jgi:predicted transcriptional regulator of viral defense system|nr:type IV toxin-antitoxin system AbiEi family antitoxin domain-containing protein [Candidatus Paceibacterota bacterium]HRT55822.1 type IV toxin-antitoxin system AbiEi family antitoxin domain-containing protein [Candidatus Paceibacterota bacterium]
MRRTTTKQDRVLSLARKKKILRLKDVTDEGLHPEHLRRLHRKGLLVRSDRGVYRLAKAEFSEKLSLAEVAKRVPNAVVCLLSALLYHEIGTQLPHEVWLAVKRRAALPRGVHTRLRIVTVSEPSYGAGIEEHEIDGVPVRVYCPAKTVADCFRFRNRVGLDVALEALRDAWRKRKVTMADLERFAKINRVTTVIRPYLEMLT